MRKILIVISVLAIFFTSCNKDEENITVELKKGRYHLIDSPNDYVKHYVYEFFQKYGTVLVVNPEEQDYKYNFVTEVKVDLVPPAQEEEIFKSGMQLLDELFLSKYDEEFKAKYLPFKLELCDTIKSRNSSSWKYYNTYTSHGFMAISHINTQTRDMSAALKKQIELELNLDFWYKFLVGARGAIILPTSFFEISQNYYKESPSPAPESKDDLIEMMHDAGFIDYPDSGSSSYKYEYYPSQEEDLLCFFSIILTTPKAELQKILEANIKIKSKYDILRKSIQANLSFDIATFPLEDLNK